MMHTLEIMMRVIQFDIKSIKLMIEFYGVSKIEELTQDQLDEIFIYSEDDQCDPWIGVALRSLVQSVQG